MSKKGGNKKAAAAAEDQGTPRFPDEKLSPAPGPRFFSGVGTTVL